MNFLGHTYVALATGNADPEYLLGAVLPDLAPMAGVRVRRAELDGALADGVRCHLRADAAFHAHADFRAGSRALRRRLLDRHVGSGPARAVGHAGWELLLDGTLVGTGAEDAFHEALTVGACAAGAMSDEDGARWTTFLGRVAGGGRLGYDDPGWVADRLHAMLAHRPRLHLPRSQVATVAEVLTGQLDAVVASASRVLGDTATAATAPAD